MRIAITSQNFRTITGHAGKTRRFLIYHAQPGTDPVEVDRLDLPRELSFHEFGGGPHPVDGADALLTGGAGEGFVHKMAARGIRVVVTGETDPLRAVKELLQGRVVPPVPHEHDHPRQGAGRSSVPPRNNLPSGVPTMYAFNVQLDLPIEEAIATFTAALADEKLGVVSDIDVQAIFKAKLGEAFRPYRILGACAAGLAKSIIAADPEAGALLPCTVVVQENEGGTLVSFMDPVPVLGLAGNPLIDEVAAEARAVLERVANHLRD